ncbi:hypothetical protein RB595_000122 [Gaeumannomyces hyphopodioides]
MILNAAVLLFQEPKALLGATLILAAIVVIWSWRRSRTSYRPPSGLVEKPASGRPSPGSRIPGQWAPSSYRFPTPPPYPSWDVQTTKPLPYRAFRHGPKYNVTMGLRSIKPEDWIQLDSDYPKYHTEKARRIAERGDKCCTTHPEAYPAALELLDELAAYLPARYPTLFRRTAVGVDNLWSGESFNLVERPLREDPMAICGRLVQDDLALVVERPDGQYYLLAGSILLPGFWRLGDKFGMPLSRVHTSGDVPEFKEKLECGMTKFFRRLSPHELYARNNYFLQLDAGLDWSPSIGPEDDPNTSWGTADVCVDAAECWFRSERQSLRRLPRSGAVCFTIRTYFHPVAEVASEDYVPGRLASAIRSWGPDVAAYKGRDKYQGVLLEYLDGEHQKQVERGLDLELEEKVCSYPW